MQAASAFRSPAFSAAAAAAGTTAAATTAGTTAAAIASSSSLSASSVLRSVLSKEGWRGLWRGADFALLMSLPMVGVYMPLYDDALAALRALPGKVEAEGKGKEGSIARVLASDAVAPALAGGAARAVAVLATSPLELARTRAQAPPEWAASRGTGAPPSASPLSSTTSNGSSSSLRALLPRASTPGLPAAVRAAWTGSAATLARDVPFSALYWALLEPVRSGTLRWWGRFGGNERSLLSLPPPPSLSSSSSPQSSFSSSSQPPPASAVVFANLVSGATAGAAAAALTTPLDVVKTKLQLEAPGSGGSGNGKTTASVLSTLRSLHARGGARALFSGVGPRSARAAPACAIVVAVYELLKLAGSGRSNGLSGSEAGGGGDWSDEEGLGLAAEEN